MASSNSAPGNNKKSDFILVATVNDFCLLPSLPIKEGSNKDIFVDNLKWSNGDYFPLSSETKDRFWMFRRNAAYLLIPPESKHDIWFVANFSFYLLLKATRKQEAIWRSRLYPRTRCLHLVNIWLQPWLRVQKIEASACSSPAECLELPAGEWRRERWESIRSRL